MKKIIRNTAVIQFSVEAFQMSIVSWVYSSERYDWVNKYRVYFNTVRLKHGN